MDAQTASRDATPGVPDGQPTAAPRTSRSRPADTADLPVHSVMTTRVLVATPDDDILLAWELMVQAGVRHLPVVDGTRLVGMIDDRRLLAEGTSHPFVGVPRHVRNLVDHPPLQVHADATLRECERRRDEAREEHRRVQWLIEQRENALALYRL